MSHLYRWQQKGSTPLEGTEADVTQIPVLNHPYLFHSALPSFLGLCVSEL